LAGCAALIIFERTGRAIRSPAVETTTSHAGKSIGRSWVFGLNETLHPTGATVGPLDSWNSPEAIFFRKPCFLAKILRPTPARFAVMVGLFRCDFAAL
jgi:hypothetical protein